MIKTIKEYLEVVRKGIKNRDKIIEALAVSAQVKNGTISPEALAEILRRKDICASCPFNSKNAIDYKSDLKFEHCIWCRCRIGGDDTKEFCLSCQCGISEYNKEHPESPMELKWKKFEENKI